jgi:hypothetical protein
MENMTRHPGSSWIEKHWIELETEYNNQWVAASHSRVMANGETFDLVLNELFRQEVRISDVVFVFLTKDVIQ